MAKSRTLSTHQKGKKAEGRAAAFLRLKGYRILERNYRVGQGEIDLIAAKGGLLVFVEVKARRGTAQGTPLEAVTSHKVRRLSAAAAHYLASRPPGTASCRFDVITLGPDRDWLGFHKIRHVQNAFSVEGFFNA